MRYRGLINATSDSGTAALDGATGDAVSRSKGEDVVSFKDREWRADGARITRVIHGPVHMVHTKDPQICEKVNRGVSLAPANPMLSDSEGRPVGRTRQLLMRFRKPAANISDYRAKQIACERDVGGEACEILPMEAVGECKRTLDLDPVDCPFTSDTHAMYLFWRGNGGWNRTTWCDQHFCLSNWLKNRVFGSEPSHEMESSSGPLTPAQVEERANARIFGALDYASMNVIFEPPLEPLSNLPKLLAELKRIPEVTDGAKLPKHLVDIESSISSSRKLL